MNAKASIFYLSRRRLQVYRPQGGRLSVVASFEDGPSQQAECARFLQAQAPGLIQVLVDVADEDFHAVSIPRLGRRDRVLMLRRKIDQFYRSTIYRTATGQGWIDAAQREEEMLFSALPDAQWMDHWLDLFEEYGQILCGIVTPALLTQQLIPSLFPQERHLLLISLQAGGELRQTYADAGQVKFSRLLALEPSNSHELGKRLRLEAQRTLQFVQSMRMFASGEHLHVAIIASPGQRQSLDSAALNQDMMHFNVMEAGPVLHRLGLPVTGQSDSQSIFVALAHEAAVNHYAPPERLYAFRRWQLGRLLSGSALVLGVIAMLIFFWFTAGTAQLQQDLALLQRSLQPMQMRLQQMQPHDRQQAADQQRLAVELYQRYLRGWPQPEQGLQHLAILLERHPALKPQHVGWMYTPDPAADPLRVGTAQMLESLAEDSLDSLESGVAANPAGLPVAYLILALAGRVEPEGIGHRDALALLDRFERDAIASGAKLDWGQLPLDTRPSSSLSASMDARPASFRARIIFPVANSEQIAWPSRSKSSADPVRTDLGHNHEK